MFNSDTVNKILAGYQQPEYQSECVTPAHDTVDTLIATREYYTNVRKQLTPALNYIQAHRAELGLQWGDSIIEWIGNNLAAIIQERDQLRAAIKQKTI